MKKYFLTSSERDALLSLLSDVLASSNDLNSIDLGESKKPFYEIHPFILISQHHYDMLHGIQYTLSKL